MTSHFIVNIVLLIVTTGLLVSLSAAIVVDAEAKPNTQSRRSASAIILDGDTIVGTLDKIES